MLAQQVVRVLAGSLTVFALGCAYSPRVATLAKESAVIASEARLTLNLPAFTTLDDLRTWGRPRDETEKFELFETAESKVAVIVVTWGSGDGWNVVILYGHDRLRDLWTPRAVWNTEAREVVVKFEKETGTLHVCSSGGVPIFVGDLLAFASRSSRDW